MGIEMQCVPVQPGQTALFNFQNQVEAYVLGIWAFSIVYGTSVDHWVQTASIKMLPSQDAGVVGNQVSAIVEVILTDGQGHNIDVSDSILYTVCLAVTGTADSNTVLTNLSGIANGSYQQISLPGSFQYSVAASCQSGFNLSFDSNNQILGMSAGCGLSYNESEGQVTASASMFDSAGHSAQTATVDAGVIASTDANPGFQVVEVTDQILSPITVIMDQLTSIGQVICMIRRWNVQFDSPHNVKQLQVGSWGPPTTLGNVVTLPNLSAQINDNSQNQQDPSLSSATILVIAIP
jgi:hypothetical protein